MTNNELNLLVFQFKVTLFIMGGVAAIFYGITQINDGVTGITVGAIITMVGIAVIVLSGIDIRLRLADKPILGENK